MHFGLFAGQRLATWHRKDMECLSCPWDVTLWAVAALAAPPKTGGALWAGLRSGLAAAASPLLRGGVCAQGWEEGPPSLDRVQGERGSRSIVSRRMIQLTEAAVHIWIPNRVRKSLYLKHRIHLSTQQILCAERWGYRANVSFLPSAPAFLQSYGLNVSVLRSHTQDVEATHLFLEMWNIVVNANSGWCTASSRRFTTWEFRRV